MIGGRHECTCVYMFMCARVMARKVGKKKPSGNQPGARGDACCCIGSHHFNPPIPRHQSNNALTRTRRRSPVKSIGPPALIQSMLSRTGALWLAAPSPPPPPPPSSSSAPFFF